jgi:hypothetical protein
VSELRFDQGPKVLLRSPSFSQLFVELVPNGLKLLTIRKERIVNSNPNRAYDIG